MDSLFAIHERLLQAPWARQLTGPQLSRVSRETQVTSFPAGAVVCREGEPALHWIGVLDGMVKVDTVSAEGRGTTFIGVSTGGWLGEGALLKRESRPYEIVALRESWIALLPMATFHWLFETSLPFNHFLVHQLNARLGQVFAVVKSHRVQSITTQVAVSIAGLFNPALCSGPFLDMRISQEEIARLCGLSRQVVGRALHALENDGVLTMHYGTIHVLDAERLQDYAAKH